MRQVVVNVVEERLLVDVRLPLLPELNIQRLTDTKSGGLRLVLGVGVAYDLAAQLLSSIYSYINIRCMQSLGVVGRLRLLGVQLHLRCLEPFKVSLHLILLHAKLDFNESGRLLAAALILSL